MLGQQSHNGAFKRIQLAGAFGDFTRLIFFHGDPFADRAFVQAQGLRDLRHRQVFFIAQLPQPMESWVINHWAPPSATRRRISPTLKHWPKRGTGAGVAAGGNAST
jgi:hypothetical protein